MQGWVDSLYTWLDGQTDRQIPQIIKDLKLYYIVFKQMVWIDAQRDRDMERQRDRRVGGQSMDSQIDGQTDREIEIWRDRETERLMCDGYGTDSQIDRYIDRQADRQIDR